jgi:hypothetical protein
MAIAASTCVSTAAEGSATQISVAVYGDSLSWQASGYLAHDFSGATVLTTTHVKPGTSLCDWLPDIAALTPADAPNVAILEFVGNASACDQSVTAPAALAAAYKADLQTAVSSLLADGVHWIVIDEGPIVMCTKHPYCYAQFELHAAFKAVAATSGSAVVYASAADRGVETLGGQFTWTLPCLAVEHKVGRCAMGKAETVRQPDGIHFCPVKSGGVKMTPCPLYASGAYRFALGFAKIIWKLEPATRPAVALRP